LRPGYFRLAPLEEEESFKRADGKHEEILRWLKTTRDLVLYLTGLSGSGKSSLLAAWVLPKLERQDTVVIRLRGYQDPVAMLLLELQRSGVIWQKPSGEISDIRLLLDRACRHIRPRRLLIVLDQFEEFLILQSSGQPERLLQLLGSLRQRPIHEVTVLLVCRSDYIGMIEKLKLPPLVQNINWKEVPPFTERAARDFLRNSGLKISDELLVDVLREAAEIEQTKGLIRPVTVNLCGLVLGRFAGGLPRGFRPGEMIRGFLRESVLLPSVRDIAPHLIPHLITSYLTRRSRSIVELAQGTTLDPAAIQCCLRVLGQSDRAIVRPLDANQQTWEVSHDFLVPLLDSIIAHWSVSLWSRFRSWLPWLVTAILALAIVAVSNWRKTPLEELVDLRWTVHGNNDGVRVFEFHGIPPRKSIKLLQQIGTPVHVKLSGISGLLDASISEWDSLKSISVLDLSGTEVTDVTALRTLKNLASLNLSSTRVTNISALQDLEYLSKLYLSNNSRVSDVSALKNLRNLTVLDLSGTKVSDVSALENLKSLTVLDLSGTEVSDVSALRNLKSLSTLNLNSTSVNNVSVLKDLNLSTLNLRFRGNVVVNGVISLVMTATLEDLKGLKSLSTLDLSGAHVSDLSPLTELKNLSTLNLNSTDVIDVVPLRNLKNLSILNLSSTNVVDISPLKDLVRLSTLDLSYNQGLSNVSALENLRNLSVLKISYTGVSNIYALKGLNSLSELDLSLTSVKDISALSELKNLSTLNLSSCSQVNEIAALAGLEKLSKLDLSFTQVSDISALKDLRELSVLDLSDIVGDTSALKDLKSLQINCGACDRGHSVLR
jgi:Leucine-rich repeat (LRR) protein